MDLISHLARVTILRARYCDRFSRIDFETITRPLVKNEISVHESLTMDVIESLQIKWPNA